MQGIFVLLRCVITRAQVVYHVNIGNVLAHDGWMSMSMMQVLNHITDTTLCFFVLPCATLCYLVLLLNVQIVSPYILITAGHSYIL